MKELNFVFEDLKNHLNFTNCKDLNNSGISRFTPSPVATSCIRRFNVEYKQVDFGITESNNTDNTNVIIIPTGVAHSPTDWCGYVDLNKCYDNAMNKSYSVLYYLKPEYLKRLQDKTAFLLLDQTHEGYHAEWLFEWFHDMCNQYEVSPTQIIYITGDLDVTSKYESWCKTNLIDNKLVTIGYPHFEHVIHKEAANRIAIRKENPVPNIAKHLLHKKNNQIYVYNCLQKRARAHRAWMYRELFNSSLLESGIVSMNKFEVHKSYYEGKTICQEDYDRFINYLPVFPPAKTTTYEQDTFESVTGGKYITDLNDDVMLDSWVTVVSEASFAENQCFISEKSFKPIVGHHPFIIYGNKGSLAKLHEMGYRTFNKWWDESYDTLDTWERLSAIINILRSLQKMSRQELYTMFCDMREVLKHNLQNLNNRCTAVDPIIKTLLEGVNETE